MSALAKSLTRAAWSALGGAENAVQSITFTHAGELPSRYAVTDFASATIAAAGLALFQLLEKRGTTRLAAVVDRRLASFWFGLSIRPRGWQLPQIWDPIAGDYPTLDGWIRLHTNAPHHRAAVERVLGAHRDKENVGRAVAGWCKGELEQAVIEAGGCAAEMRTATEWALHRQGIALANEPLTHNMEVGSGPSPHWKVSRERPLAGVRVLDLTRVLAGPVAGRFLAGYGAEVLRIDPPGWDEPGIVPEVTLGKRCARLDLDRSDHRAIFERLLSQTDILLHGYRPGALAGLGYGPAACQALTPGLVDVCLDAYGWSGPWAARRGFDSLVQMSSGIADTGMRWRNADRPVPLPVQALDQGTGYLMAAAAIRGLTLRLERGVGFAARLSLARTANLLVEAGDQADVSPLAPETPVDLMSTPEVTDWGDAHRVLPPLSIAGTPMHWDIPARKLGSAEPRWDRPGTP